MKTVASALMLSALLTSSFAFADEASFKAADADSDGALSVAEIMAAFPAASEEAFEEADADSNGTLDQAEFDAAVDAGVLVKS